MAYIGDVCEEMSRRLQFLAKKENDMKSMTFEDVDGEYVAAFDDKGTTVRGIIHDGVMYTSTGPNLKCEDLRLVQRPIEHSYRGFINEMTRNAQKLEDVARYIESGLDQCAGFERFLFQRDMLRAKYPVSVSGTTFIYWFDSDNDEGRLDILDITENQADGEEYALISLRTRRLLIESPGLLSGVNLGFSVERRDVMDGVEVGDVLTMTTGLEFRAKVPTPKVTEGQKISMGDGVFLYSDCVESVVRFGEPKPPVPTEPGLYKGADGTVYLIMSWSFCQEVTRILHRPGDSEWTCDFTDYGKLPEDNAPYTRIEV